MSRLCLVSVLFVHLFYTSNLRSILVRPILEKKIDSIEDISKGTKVFLVDLKDSIHASDDAANHNSKKSIDFI